MKRLTKFARAANSVGNEVTVETLKRNFRRTPPSKRGAALRLAQSILDRAARAAGKQSEVRSYLSGGPRC